VVTCTPSCVVTGTERPLLADLVGPGLEALEGTTGPSERAAAGRRPTCDDLAVPITFAHRGARLEAPENTLEAFRLALARGVTGLETDAHLSADGQVVLVHDASVRTGVRRRRVAMTSAEELAALGVPSLDSLYEELGTEFELSIDCKAPGVGPAIVEVAARFGAVERLWLCSPDVDELGTIPADGAHVVHSTRKDLVGAPVERHAARLGELHVDAMNMHHTEWTAGLVSLFHRFGVQAFAWDAQEERHLRAMLRIGIDGLYCDRPERLVSVVREWNRSGGAIVSPRALEETDS
jgi:glycerophosphoryl diester phosphodiesterase